MSTTIATMNNISVGEGVSLPARPLILSEDKTARLIAVKMSSLGELKAFCGHFMKERGEDEFLSIKEGLGINDDMPRGQAIFAFIHVKSPAFMRDVSVLMRGDIHLRCVECLDEKPVTLFAYKLLADMVGPGKMPHIICEIIKPQPPAMHWKEPQYRAGLY